LNRKRFFKVVWSTLLIYELLQGLLFLTLLWHTPAGLSSSVEILLRGIPVLAALLPLYLVFSFMGILGRSRLVMAVFLGSFFMEAVFLSGTFLSRVLLSAFPRFSSHDPWTLSEAGGGLLIFLLLSIATKERLFSPHVYRTSLRFPDLSHDLAGLTVLHMSDLHVGSWQSDRSLRRISRKAAELAPDLLVFTGDMIDHSEAEIMRFESLFGNLEGRYGTFAVLGNHEYWTLGAAAPDVLRKAGVPVLKNESRSLLRGLGRIFVVGIDDPAGREVSPDCGPDLKSAYRSVNPAPGDLVITLVHQPTLWDGEVQSRSHLTLSGHTHGGQMGRRRQRWSLARFFFPHDVGLFRSDETGGAGHYLHVSSGLGYYGVPLRIGMMPEMTFFTIE